MIHKVQALSEFADTWLKASPRGTHTVRAYLTELDRLDQFLRKLGREWDRLDPHLLERFWRELTRGAWHETQQRPSASSLNQSRRIISAFLRWMVGQGLASTSVLPVMAGWHVPMGGPKTKVAITPRRRSLPVTRLLDVSELDAAAAAMCYWAGATPNELSALATADLDLPRATVTLTQRGVSRTVAIPRPLAKSLQPLLAKAGPWVFRAGPEPPSAAAMGQRVARWLGSHGGGALGSARALRAQFQRHAQAVGWSNDDIRAQLRRPTLPLPLAPAPSHRQLAALVPAGP
jgi:integrase